MTNADSGPASAARLLEAWERFVALLGSTTDRQLLGTAEAVEALLARSELAHVTESGASVDRGRLDAADTGYRAGAGWLLGSTRLALYADDHPDAEWWWRPGSFLGRPVPTSYVDVPAVATVKGVHANTVRAAIHSGELPARRLGRGFLVQASDVESWQPRSVGRPRRQASAEGDELLNAFNIANEAGDFAGAHEIALRLVEVPSSARRCLAIAIDCYNGGRHDQTLAWLDRARTIGLVGDGEAREGLVRGLALIQLGRSDEAIDVLRAQAGPRTPLRWKVRAALVDALLAGDRATQAEQVVDEALRERPDASEFRYLAARVRFHDSRPAQALSDVLLFRRTAPTDPAGALLHGSILGRLGDLAGDDRLYLDAKSIFATALEQEPTMARAKLALTCGRLGQWKESLDHVASIGGAVPPETVEQLIRAAMLGTAIRLSVEQTAEAAAYAETAVVPTAFTRVFIALGQAVGGRLDEARDILHADVPADLPTEPEIDFLVGVTYMATADPQRAMARFQRYAFRPGSPSIAKVLWCQAAAAAGDFDQAESVLRLLSSDDSELGVLAGVAVLAIRNHGGVQMVPEDELHETLRALHSGSGLSSGLLPWDLQHRDVSTVVERSVHAGLPN